MKITQLELEAFRSFTGIGLPLGAARVLVSGVNEAGKSSIREAIRWALTGKVKNHDGSTLETVDLVPVTDPASGVSVTADVQPIGVMARSWVKATGMDLHVQGFTGTPASQQQALLDKLGTTEPFLHAILDTSAFLRLHHSEAKALVLGLLNAQVEIEDSAKNRVGYTLDMLDAAYKTAFDDRRLAKQRLKTLTIPVKPLGSFAAISAIDGRLATLRAELDSLNTAVGATAGQQQAIQRQLDATGAYPHFQPADPGDLSAPIAELEKRLASMEAEAVPEAPESAPLPSNKPTMDVAALKARGEALAAFQPKKGCVLDEKIDCPVHKLKFANRGRDILDFLPKDKGSPAPTQRPVNPLTAVRKELDGLRAQQASFERAKVDDQIRQANRDRFAQELAALPDTFEQESQIVAVRERIQKGEGIRKAASAYQDEVRRYDLAAKAHTDQTSEVARLEALCEVLGPSGARVDALTKALGPFEAEINTFTGAFGWAVEFLVEPWCVVVNRRPVETYSKSAQFRIGIALQIAIAKLSGLNFAIVDELDMLDAKNRELVGAMLLQSELEQVIILGTRDPSSPLPKVDGMISYRIGQVDGRSQILETTGA